MGTKQDEEGFWIRKLRQMPRWVLCLLIAALFTLILLGRDFLIGETLEPARIVFTAASGVIASALTFGFERWHDARERKKPVGSPTVSNFKAAMSTGRLPQHAEAEQWVPELTKTIRLERHLGWIGPLLFAGFAALGVFLIIDNPDHPWFWVIATVGFAAIAAWYPTGVARRRKKLENLIAGFSARDERARGAR